LSIDDFLISYLSSAKGNVDTIIKKLRDVAESSQSIDQQAMDSGNSNADTFALLEELVTQIQKIVLDVFFLFLKPFPDATKSSCEGLERLYQSKIVANVDEVLYRLTGTHAEIPTSNSTEATKSSSQLIRSFDKWFAANIVEPCSLCVSSVLTSLYSSAEEISSLQKRLWSKLSQIESSSDSSIESSRPRSNSVSTIEKVESSSAAGRLSYSQDDWMEASKNLISARKQLGYGKSAALTYPWDPLWSMIFQSAFLAQVDRQLHASSSAAYLQIKQLIVDVMQTEGLYFNMEKSELSLHHREIKSAGSFPRPHSMAEKIRSAFQHHVLATAGSTVNNATALEADSASGESLFASSVHMKLCQLVSYLFVFLREYSSAIHEMMKKIMAAPSIEDVQLLSNANLFLGRVAWLLLCRGSFLQVSLGIQRQKLSSKGNNDVLYGMSSEEQLMSAFEIADTNGDGLVTCEEAEEAILALAVDRSSDIERSLLSSTLTPRLSFDEFSLITLHLQTTDVRLKAIRRVGGLLQGLLQQCHQSAADGIVWLASNHSQTLHQHFLTTNKVSEVASFWIMASVRDKDGNETGDRYHLPSGASMSLMTFLSKLAVDLGSFTSSSTIESIFRNDAMNADTAFSFDDRSLAKQMLGLVMQQAIKALTDRYKCYEASDEVVLQCIVDISLCTRLFGSSNKDLNALLADWKNCVDPVDGVLFLPLLDDIVTRQLQSCRMLLPWTETWLANIDEGSSGLESSNIALLPKSSCRFSMLPLPLALSGQTKHRDVSEILQPVQTQATKPKTISKASSNKEASSSSNLLNSLGSFGNSFLGTK
jgi:hypothetical protein